MPYFSCQTSYQLSLSLKYPYDYQWKELSAKEHAAAFDVTALILQDWLKGVGASERDKEIKALALQTSSDAFEAFVSYLEAKRPELPKASKYSKPRLKCSMEMLNLIPLAPGVPSLRLIEKALALFSEWVEDYEVVFDFHEIFLVPEGKEPPPHYRAGIDEIVRNKKDFDKKVNTLGYQVAKAMFNVFLPEELKQDSKLASYSKTKSRVQKDKARELDSPLCKKPYYSSIFEAVLSFETGKSWSINLPSKEGVITLAFGPEVYPSELKGKLCLDIFDSGSEIILTFQDEKYKDEEERAKAYAECLEFIKANNVKTIVHVFLQTQKSVEKNLLKILPETLDLEQSFTPLRDHSGFYLSSKEFFSTIYQNRQKKIHYERLEPYSATMHETKEQDTCFFQVFKDDLTCFLYSLESKQFEAYQISWDALPEDFPRDEALILNLKPEEKFYQLLEAELLKRHSEKEWYWTKMGLDIKVKKLKALEASKPPVSSYIYSQRDDFRPSKLLTKEAIKGKATLAKTLNQDLSQDLKQDLNQDLNQNLTQGFKQNLNQNHTKSTSINEGSDYFDFLRPKLNLKGFCEELKTNAEKRLRLSFLQKDPRLESIYLVEHHRDSHGERAFFQRLRQDEEFRLQIAAKIFGYAHTGAKGEEALVYLPGYTLDSIDSSCLFGLLGEEQSHLGGFLDGLNPETCVLSKGLFGSCLKNVPRVFDQEHFFLEAPLYSSILPAFASALGGSCRQHEYSPSLLLKDRDLEKLLPEERAKLISQAQSLLALFKLDGIGKSAGTELALKQEALLDLTRSYFPDSLHAKTLEGFFSLLGGAKEEDLRILTQLLISESKEGLEKFFDLLKAVEEAKLLKEFHKLYFQYANNIFSLVELVKAPFRDGFIEAFLSLGSIAESARFSPLFQRFFLQFSIFEAKSHRRMAIISNLFKCKDFWNELSLKILRYTGYQEEEAKSLLEALLKSLSSEDGLALGELASMETFFLGFNRLIDKAMANQCLEEQLKNMAGLSFAYTDLPYALKSNGFRVVSAEMELKGSSINPQKQSYAVSRDELIESLKDHEGGSLLKRHLFRYLGGVRFREDLSLYQELYQALDEIKDGAFQELLLAYYVLESTDKNYQKKLEAKEFYQGFMAFFKDHPRYSSFDGVRVYESISRFIETLQTKKTDAEKGTTTLWTLWQSAKVSPLLNQDKRWGEELSIPEILTKKCSRHDLKSFLLKNRQALESSLPLLAKEDELSFSLMRLWFKEEKKGHFGKTGLSILRSIYSPKQGYPQGLSFDVFLQDLVKIIEFQEAYSLLVERFAKAKTFIALKHLIEEKALNIEQSINLVELVSQELAEHKQNKRAEPRCAEFIKALSLHEELFQELGSKDSLLKPLLKYYLSTSHPDLSLGFSLVKTLKDSALEEKPRLLNSLLRLLQRGGDAYSFFRKHRALSAAPWRLIVKIVEGFEEPELVLNAIDLALDDGLKLESFEETLKTLPKKDRVKILTLARNLALDLDRAIVPQMEALKALSSQDLEDLYQLYELYDLKAADLASLLETTPISQALIDFSRKKQLENLKYYDYDATELWQKIQALRYKTSTEELALDLKLQEQLRKDYHSLMAYMQTKPILIEVDGLGKRQEFNINQLSKAQMQALFKSLTKKISEEKDPLVLHEHQLMRLALICDGLCRTTNKFPRNTQILTLLCQLNVSKNLIHEVQTGEGKSLIDACQALFIFDGKKSIDIATDNKHLAAEGLNKFKALYAYFGIPCGSSIVEAESSHKAYVEGGINYSTPYDLILFRERMKLEKRSIPKNKVLICDEIDAVLTSTIEARLSVNLKEADAGTWSEVYQSLLAFVEEKKLFIENRCSSQDDVANFRMYFELKHPEKKLRDFLAIIDAKDLSQLIESAQVALSLDVNIDFMVLKKRQGEDIYSYAAPIVAKRPNPRIAYADGVQQLLHARLNQGKPSRAFKIEPQGETLITVSMKNFFDSYRANGGAIVGLTGTGGSGALLEEFLASQDLQVLAYPSFKPSLREDLNLVPCFSQEEKFKTLYEKVQTEREANQPLLIITSSPQETLELQNYLEREDLSKGPLKNIQIYHGTEEGGQSEARLTERAGQRGVITIANESLARGADIQPEAEGPGLLVFNLSSEVTPEELRQILGRAARNGQKGKTCSIIDMSAFSQPGLSVESQSQAFVQHQEALSLAQQEQRLKKRLLEESRYLIVHDYLLDLREAADAILSRQEGTATSLVSDDVLIKALYEFNQRAEEDYLQLLAKHGEVKGEAETLFLKARVEHYNQILNSWLPEKRFANYKIIEPSVPLDNLKGKEALNSLKIKDLSLMSEVLAKVWESQGHQNMAGIFTGLDALEVDFQPYLQGEKKLQETLAHVLINQGLIEEKTVLETLEGVKEQSGEWIRLASELPVIGRFIPQDDLKAFVINYLDTTKSQIEEKKYNELKVPEVNLEAYTTWFHRVSMGIKVASLLIGGPIPFIINNIVLPIAIKWLGPLFQKWFNQSDSTYLQVIGGLTGLSGDLIAFIENLQSFSLDRSLGDFLDKEAHFLQNKALQTLVIKYLELNKQTEFIPYIEVLPELLKALTPYRDKPLKELKLAEIGRVLLEEALKNETLTKAWEGSPFQDLLPRLLNLSPEALSLVSQLKLQDLYALVKVLAHPEFSRFLKSLPPEADFSALLVWINSETEVSSEVKEALNVLWTYQNNAERLAEESRQRLVNLKQEFTLSLDGLQADLRALKPQKKVEILPFETVNTPQEARTEVPFETANTPQEAEASSTTPWLLYASLSLGITGLLLANVIFFSLTLLLTSLVLASLLISPFALEFMSAEEKPVQLAKPLPLGEENKTPEPITLYLSPMEEKELIHSLPKSLEWNKTGNQNVFFMPRLKLVSEELVEERVNALFQGPCSPAA